MLNEAHVLTIANVDKIKLEYMIKDQDTNVESDIETQMRCNENAGIHTHTQENY